MAASAIELVMLLSASKCLVMLCSAAEVNMRKLAFPKSVEGISDEKVKSDFPNRIVLKIRPLKSYWVTWLKTVTKKQGTEKTRKVVQN